MSAYATLTRLTLRNRLAGLRGGSWRAENGRLDGRRILTAAAVLLCVAMAGGAVIWLEYLLYEGLRMLGQPWLLPALTLLMTMLGLAVMSFFSVMARLYFSRDTVWMAYLPARSGTVLAAKVTEIYLGEVLLSACLTLPALVMCGRELGLGALYWLRAAAVILLSPMIPLALLTLLTTALAAGTSVTRNREGWMMVGSLVMVGAVLVLEMNVLTRIPDDADSMYFLRLIMDREGLLRKLAGAFPPVMWAVRGLQGDAGQLALFALVSVGSLGLCQALLGPRYLALALKQQERGGRRRAARLEGRGMRPSGAVASLARRELREILRTPAYVTNGLASAVAFPLVMVIMVITSGMGEDAAALQTFQAVLLGGLAATDRVLILAGIAALSGIMNPVAATAVSREGERFAFNRTLPVSASARMGAKFIVAQGIALAATVLMGAPAAWMLGMGVAEAVLAVLLAQLPVAAATAFSLALDAAHPHLHFANETQAIKQNMNVFFSMLIGMGVLVLPVLAMVAAWKLGAGWRLVAALLVCAGEAAAAMVAFRRGTRAYDAFEDHRA